MAKPQAQGPRAEDFRVPSPEVAQRFSELERRVEAAIELITRLRHENRELARRLAEVERKRKQAAERIDSVLDKIDTLN